MNKLSERNKTLLILMLIGLVGILLATYNLFSEASITIWIGILFYFPITGIVLLFNMKHIKENFWMALLTTLFLVLSGFVLLIDAVVICFMISPPSMFYNY